jgi:hypothetical protein
MRTVPVGNKRNSVPQYPTAHQSLWGAPGSIVPEEFPKYSALYFEVTLCDALTKAQLYVPITRPYPEAPSVHSESKMTHSLFIRSEFIFYLQIDELEHTI